MATPSPIQQPPVMQLIRQRRKSMHLSYDRAGALAGISGTRWRQLEDARRAIRGVGYIPEVAPAATLARMAYAVGVTPAELDAQGHAEAAGELAGVLEARGREDGEAQAEAARMVAGVPGLSARQRQRLAEEIAADLRKVRDQGE
jgi:transcriptional regulator with XRE-family HTH domain